MDTVLNKEKSLPHRGVKERRDEGEGANIILDLFMLSDTKS